MKEHWRRNFKMTGWLFGGRWGREMLSPSWFCVEGIICGTRDGIRVSHRQGKCTLSLQLTDLVVFQKAEKWEASLLLILTFPLLPRESEIIGNMFLSIYKGPSTKQSSLYLSAYLILKTIPKGRDNFPHLEIRRGWETVLPVWLAKNFWWGPWISCR